MKNSISILVVACALLLSCKEESTTENFEISTASIDQLRKEKNRVISSYDSIGQILSELDIAITEKDTLKRLPVVTSIQVSDTIFNHYVEIQGSVDTDQNVLIFPEYQGMLTRVLVKEGQSVSKGQLLATIDDGGLSSQLSQLETQAQLAKTTFERQERLWKQEIGSEIQYLQTKASMESTESAVNQMKAQLRRAQVRAPFSGKIDQIITNQGQIVAPGSQALLRIINLNNMYVKASVPENYLTAINRGNEVIIEIPSLQKKVTGKVQTVGNYINPGNRTFDIQVSVPNTERDIKPNLIAKLSINDYSNEEAILIPSNIIQENSLGEKFIYVINTEGSNTIVTKTKIETGFKYDGQIEVLQGLSKGLTIVNEGALTLKDGAEISFQKNK